MVLKVVASSSDVVSGGSLEDLNFTMSLKEDIFCRVFVAVHWMGVLTLLLECENVHGLCYASCSPGARCGQGT